MKTKIWASLIQLKRQKRRKVILSKTKERFFQQKTKLIVPYYFPAFPAFPAFPSISSVWCVMTFEIHWKSIKTIIKKQIKNMIEETWLKIGKSKKRRLGREIVRVKRLKMGNLHRNCAKLCGFTGRNCVFLQVIFSLVGLDTSWAFQNANAE